MRFTLRYVTKNGTPIVLFNLLRTAVDEITRVQTYLGSTNFAYEPQSHNFSQQELDLIRQKGE
jgi:hypothetical protein